MAKTANPDSLPISAKPSLLFYVPFALVLLFIDFVIFYNFFEGQWTAIVYLPIFAPLTIRCLWMVLDRRPFLTLDEVGILDRGAGLQKTPWTEFSSARLVAGFRGTFLLQLEPKNPDQWITLRLSRTRRLLSKLTGLQTCYVFLSFYDKKPIDIYKYVIQKIPGGWL